MALFDANNDDRTEPASPYRREEFRKQGRVALSREILSVSLLLTVGLSLYLSGHHLYEQMSLVFGRFFQFDKVDALGKPELVGFARDAARAWVWAVGPLFAVGMSAALLTGAAQVGFVFTTEPLVPNWDRINPVNGLSRLFSGRGALEAAKGLVKLLVGGWLLWTFVKGLEPVAGTLFRREVSEALMLMAGLVGKLFLQLVLAFTVLAGLDYAYQRWDLEKQMRMTRREVRDEFKLREGDPLIKSRIKSLQRKIASKRMMEDVPKADVVVTNPTHLAVALRYDGDTMAAPKVVAKGAGVIAQKIRELARAAGVPIVENKPLARTLYKEIDVGGYIPRELYKAVAQVLSYVYRLKGRTVKA